MHLPTVLHLVDCRVHLRSYRRISVPLRTAPSLQDSLKSIPFLFSVFCLVIDALDFSVFNKRFENIYSKQFSCLQNYLVISSLSFFEYQRDVCKFCHDKLDSLHEVELPWRVTVSGFIARPPYTFSLQTMTLVAYFRPAAGCQNDLLLRYWPFQLYTYNISFCTGSLTKLAQHSGTILKWTRTTTRLTVIVYLNILLPRIELGKAE